MTRYEGDSRMSKKEHQPDSMAWATGTSLQAKFTLGMLVILIGLTAFLSYWLYRSLEQNLIDSVDEKSRIILHELEATRSYVRDTLRPRISSIVSSDEFIIEAMSTSYVSRKIMERFKEWYPEFSYKRVAQNPRNPDNRASLFEITITKQLDRDRNLKEWQGIRTIDGTRFFVRMTPLVHGKGVPTMPRGPKGLSGEAHRVIRKRRRIRKEAWRCRGHGCTVIPH